MSQFIKKMIAYRGEGEDQMQLRRIPITKKWRQLKEKNVQKKASGLHLKREMRYGSIEWKRQKGK